MQQLSVNHLYFRIQGTQGEYTGGRSPLKIKSLWLIKTAKPSVCLSGSVSSAAGGYLGLCSGLYWTVGEQPESSQLALAAAPWTKSPFHSLRPLAGEQHETSGGAAAQRELGTRRRPSSV